MATDDPQHAAQVTKLSVVLRDLSLDAKHPGLQLAEHLVVLVEHHRSLGLDTRGTCIGY